MELQNQDIVTVTGSEIRVHVTTTIEAKLAIKELRLKKKEFILQKKNIALQQRQIRSTYTNEVRQQGAMMRGGGGIGSFVRTIQSTSRDSRRRQLANDLEPLDRQKIEIEQIISKIDAMILQIENAIVNNSF